MRITTVGTGTAAPHPRRVQSAVFIEVADLRLLIDCGSGAVHRMAELGVPWATLTHVALTHFHADHTSDLATLLFAWRWGQLPPRSEPATVIGPPGTIDLLRKHADAMGGSMLEAIPSLTIAELAPGETMQLGPYALEARKVPHTVESVAYSLSGDGRRLVVSGDMAFDPSFAEWARGSDVLVCECSLPDSLAAPTHLTPRQCGHLGALAEPGLLALTHLYPPVEQVDIVGEVRESYAGPVVVCDDGWTLDL
ncbi:MAG: MBL fold metallo-hydrolase [Gemmatimonadaceae bacterium]